MGKTHVESWMTSRADSWEFKSHKSNQIISGHTETSDLLVFTAPPIQGSGRGLLTVRRQHESPHGAGYHVQVEHRVTLAERQIERQAGSGIKIAEEEQNVKIW